ncbi:hypothetical protein Gorai_003397 [Gossypium raimondii]|uniref:Reverse transcriptase zinc-binding domain-containing protein n=1 Tax=Gossypium raimondii TaxID=29730 RepID=A0A7J8QNU6_GOSRA|nr:hypothetical protein [Gossypium raimondii]
MVTEEGLWNLDIFKIWLSDDVIWRIMCIMASWSAKDDKWKCAWKLPVDLSCPLCGHALEGILHILKDCTIAKAIWRQDTTKIHERGANWSCFFGLLAWRIYGAVQLHSGNAAAEEIVRDETGDWVFGYNRYLGKYSIFDAEL